MNLIEKGMLETMIIRSLRAKNTARALSLMIKYLKDQGLDIKFPTIDNFEKLKKLGLELW